MVVVITKIFNLPLLHCSEGHNLLFNMCELLQGVLTKSQDECLQHHSHVMSHIQADNTHT